MWTEEEAGTKWCQESRTVQTDGVSSSAPRNRVANTVTMETEADHLFGARCIGSRCMSWRWVDKAGTNEAGEPNYYAGHWKGYCGKAGRP